MSSGPAAPRSILSDLGRCVPDMDYDDDDVVRLAQRQSTRLWIWVSRVRLPYQHHHNCRLVPDANAATGVTQEPEGGGRAQDPPPVCLLHVAELETPIGNAETRI